MLDLIEELRKLVSNLKQNKIHYALCGGMAMGVHGRARATIDIDMLVLSESVEQVLAIARSLGYNIRGKDLSLAKSAIETRRVSKIDSEDGELLSLDLLIVTPEIRSIWESRLEAEWEGGKLCVVSASGLISLKQLRGSAQDLADIDALRDNSDEASDMSATAVTARLKRVEQLRRLCLSLKRARLPLEGNDPKINKQGGESQQTRTEK